MPNPISAEPRVPITPWTEDPVPAIGAICSIARVPKLEEVKAKQAIAPKGEKPAGDTPARSSAPSITTASIASFVNGLKAEQHLADSGRATAKDAKAKYDSNSQGAMQTWMDKSQKYSDCTSEAEDNHPRKQERNKLQTSAGMARYKGETKKAA